MSCKTCEEISIAGCEETLCDGTISLPCSEEIAAKCVKVTDAYSNIGSSACDTLDEVLTDIDSKINVDVYLDSAELDGTTLTLTLNDATEIDVDLAALVVDTFWDRNSGSGFIFPSTLTDKVGIGTNIPQHLLDVNGTFGNNNVPALNEDINIINDEYTLTSISGVSAPFTADVAMLRYGTGATQQSVIYASKNLAAIAFDDTSSVAALGVSSGVASVKVSSTATAFGSVITSATDTKLEVTDGVDTTILRATKDDLIIDGNNGWSGTFTNGDGATVTVTKGLITNVV